jgi:hypothetical protein
MAKHDKLLEQGAREAPAPETAEERSKRLGWGGAAGGTVAAGGIAALKFGGLTKLFIWLFAWHGALNAYRLGGWIAIAVVAAALATFFVLRSRREA